MSQQEETTKPLLGKNGFVYKEQYGVIVHCRDEHHQQSVYQTLLEQGHKIKVVSV